jgi:hypothetical protein
MRGRIEQSTKLNRKSLGEEDVSYVPRQRVDSIPFTGKEAHRARISWTFTTVDLQTGPSRVKYPLA